MKSKISVLGHEDADEYHKLMEAMKTLGFKDVELRETFKLLAALLQIGNFEFEEAMIDNLDACHLIYNSGVKLGCPLLTRDPWTVKYGDRPVRLGPIFSKLRWLWSDTVRDVLNFIGPASAWS